MSKLWAVYDLIVDGERWYVGCSCQPVLRLRYHKARGTAPRNAVIAVVRWYDDRAKAMTAERRRIRKYKPKGNTLSKRSRLEIAQDAAERKSERAIQKVREEIKRYDAALKRGRHPPRHYLQKPPPTGLGPRWGTGKE